MCFFVSQIYLLKKIHHPLNLIAGAQSIPLTISKNQKQKFMKTKLPVLAVLALCTALIFNACKKDSSSSSLPNETTQVSTEADDQTTVSNEVDNAANDVNLMVEASASFSGKGYEIQSLICDATVAADTSSGTWKLTFTFNGSNCLGNRTRNGVIVVSTPAHTHWKNAGAAITVAFQDYKVTRTSDNKSVTLNGSIVFTNQSGGLLLNLPTLGTITHSITSSGMTITFNDGSQRTWQIAKQRVFTYSNGYVITETGTHTDGNTTGIAIWGTNRYGKSFTWQITQPLVVRQDCNFRVVSGQVVNTRPAVTATATFGLDSAGNQTTCPGTGTYYMKIVWVDASNVTRTVILPY
ncbi:MAG: hypothetical protein B6D37_12090 [Sphingobacteriales bacterium UTBCD1]|jgi:hypothetical protein|nr:MAG: hypothetical protein B6D37_12090 [Sphingobacteriales bacterium UTBCD1]